MATRKGHVLVVDDDDAFLDAVSLALQFEGFEVSTARDGLDAMIRLERQPRPDLLVVDLHMPKVDGWTLVAQVRTLPAFADVPIVGLSGSAFGLASSAEFDAYVSKPIAGNALLDTLNRLLPN